MFEHDHRQASLYHRDLEHDSCGVALLINTAGRRSHALLQRALDALARLAHRGGAGARSLSPDGTGVLTQIPWRIVDRELPAAERRTVRARALAAFFVPAADALGLQREVAVVLRDSAWRPAGWRRVPTRPDELHPSVQADAPEVWHLALSSPDDPSRAVRSLYRLRLDLEARLRPAAASLLSLSSSTVVYKGLLDPRALARFYTDLGDPEYDTAIAIVHERFSTNTSPEWELAQPFSVLAHNGEINTIAGNRSWMRARQADPLSLPELAGLESEAISSTGSDSRTLNDVVELMRAGGFDLAHAVSRLVPPAWERDSRLTPDERAFHQYQAIQSEPWDGPAALAFTDGRVAGAAMDRNGFRPARFIRTADGHLFVGSEAGIFDVPDHQVLVRGRLGPGDLVVADIHTGRVESPDNVRARLAGRRPYRRWLQGRLVPLPEPSFASEAHDLEHVGDVPRQRLFGVTGEERRMILQPMVGGGREALGSMGDDAPVAVLAGTGRDLTERFRQRFAQVTNPPLDPLRERVVMSLRVLLGPRYGWLHEGALPRPCLALPSPVLTPAQLAHIVGGRWLRVVFLPMVFDTGADGSLEEALEGLAARAGCVVREGAEVIVLSDKDVPGAGAPVPAVLAVSAVHHRLISLGLGPRASVIVETGHARDAHQIAVLLAFGAAAVVPYLGWSVAAELAATAGCGVDRGLSQYKQALDDGLLRIFSKMGVSTAQSYSGSQLFEILGLDAHLVGRFFPHAVSTLSGQTLREIEHDVRLRHRAALGDGDRPLGDPGRHRYRRDGEPRANNPVVVKALHRAARGEPEAYERFTELVYDRQPAALRDLLELVPGEPVPLEEVEPVEAICRRFFGSAMSVGALSPEAHRVLAIAMNEIGGRSNSGEGGEEAERAVRHPGRPWANSAIKQVASARFGVTPAYLASAAEIQIKFAQGSKPGEGGQLPAGKVAEHIARLRRARPGTLLISPPPHHDVYSIEDLAELIHDLREFQPAARIGVKLVAQRGVGIVAVGAVKTGAEAIQVSGHDGGTGASPRGSIVHAGLPWEIGLAEAHQTLAMNGLRAGVVLQTDGGLKTGRDVAIAAALGADEFGFGTALLVAVGCAMARQCHLDTCPVGIATQRPALRARFAGTPGMVATYLAALAAETRSILASLGLRSVQELVGQTAHLRQRRTGREALDRLDLSALLWPSSGGLATAGRRGNRPSSRAASPRTLNDDLDQAIGDGLGRRPIVLSLPVRNTDRAVGTRLAGRLARTVGDRGSTAHPLRLDLHGTAGQSLGAFLLPGMDITLTGDANDYVGKGQHGGTIAIRPPGGRGVPRETAPVLVGNAALYGATGGRLFVAGSAGERFAVRNGGALAVVEGIGDHGCEYMTGGLVVVLGLAGRNFGAGMAGGAAFVLDQDERFAERCNRDLVDVGRVGADQDGRLLAAIRAHVEATGSRTASALLKDWPGARGRFWRVTPRALREPMPEDARDEGSTVQGATADVAAAQA